MGIREDCLSREAQDRLRRAAEMPHRQNNPDAIDARLESTIGRFYLDGKISESEFQAGIRYGEIVLNYLQSIDAPGAYGEGFRDLSEATAFARKILASQARQILKDAAAVSKMKISQTEIITAVDRLAVYGEPPRDEKEQKALRIGLRALAHGSNIIPFRRKLGGKNEGESRRAGLDPVS